MVKIAKKYAISHVEIFSDIITVVGDQTGYHKPTPIGDLGPNVVVQSVCGSCGRVIIQVNSPRLRKQRQAITAGQKGPDR